ncbi:hypothetical protein [Streptomyces macrosporus]|uniref:Uncharacterized protein n=1 Tax=Streptomyces macrosporus TaxID=44032 RepID=A0ABN3KJP8_9ACTN
MRDRTDALSLTGNPLTHQGEALRWLLTIAMEDLTVHQSGREFGEG